MELILTFNKKPQLTIKYTPEEWSALESVYKKLGLQRSRTRQGLGVGLELEYYREADMELYNYVRETIQYLNGMCCTDSINEPVLYHDRFNLAVLRIIPSPDDLTVTVPLPKFLTIYELNSIVQIITKTIETIMNLVLEAKVTIRPKKDQGGAQQ